MDRSVPDKGGRELKKRFGEISQSYVKLVGAEERQDEDVWTELDRLRSEITAGWRWEGLAVEFVSQVRP